MPTKTLNFTTPNYEIELSADYDNSGKIVDFTGSWSPAIPLDPNLYVLSQTARDRIGTPASWRIIYYIRAWLALEAGSTYKVTFFDNYDVPTKIYSGQYWIRTDPEFFNWQYIRLNTVGCGIANKTNYFKSGDDPYLATPTKYIEITEYNGVTGNRRSWTQAGALQVCPQWQLTLNGSVSGTYDPITNTDDPAGLYVRMDGNYLASMNDEASAILYSPATPPNGEYIPGWGIFADWYCLTTAYHPDQHYYGGRIYADRDKNNWRRWVSGSGWTTPPVMRVLVPFRVADSYVSIRNSTNALTLDFFTY